MYIPQNHLYNNFSGTLLPFFLQQKKNQFLRIFCVFSTGGKCDQMLPSGRELEFTSKNH